LHWNAVGLIAQVRPVFFGALEADCWTRSTALFDAAQATRRSLGSPAALGRPASNLDLALDDDLLLRKL